MTDVLMILVTIQLDVHMSLTTVMMIMLVLLKFVNTTFVTIHQ